MKKFFKKSFAFLMALCLFTSLVATSALAASYDSDAKDEPVIIGQYDGPLTVTARGIEVPTSNVRIRSTATYDKDDGVQVSIELYTPALEFPKAKFKSMAGTVDVEIGRTTTSKAFYESANGDTTISTDVNTGATGRSGASGTVSVAGYATAENALNNGGAFGISYDIVIP